MKWIDLTDMLFCNIDGYTFMIKKPAFRNDVIQWWCLDSDNKELSTGKTVKIGIAKRDCKSQLEELRQEKACLNF